MRVTPFPPKLSASSLVSLLSLYGICPCRFFGSPKDDIQLPEIEKKTSFICLFVCLFDGV